MAEGRHPLSSLRSFILKLLIHWIIWKFSSKRGFLGGKEISQPGRPLKC